MSIDGSAFDSLATYGSTVLYKRGKIACVLEARTILASVPMRGYPNDGTVWLQVEQDFLGDVRRRSVMDPATGHEVITELGPATFDPPVYSTANSASAVRALVDELLAGFDLADIDFGQAKTGYWFWDDDTEEAVKRYIDAIVDSYPTAIFYELGDPDGISYSATKRKAEFRLNTVVTAYTEPLTHFAPDQVHWSTRTVKRDMTTRAMVAVVSSADIGPSVDDSTADNYYSEPIAIDPPDTSGQSVTIEGAAGGGIVTMLGSVPTNTTRGNAEMRKGGFPSYVNVEGEPVKIYRTETATGAFAGVDGEPSRSYSGNQRFTSEDLAYAQAGLTYNYTQTFSDDVPRYYVSGPFLDRSYRVSYNGTDYVEDTEGRRGFVLHSQTATVRVWRRTVKDPSSGEDVVDELTTTLSEELSTAEMVSAGDDIAEDDDLEEREVSEGVLAAKVLDPDETAYHRRRCVDLKFHVTYPMFYYPSDITFTVRWKEATVALDGTESVEDKHTEVTVAEGDGSEDSDPVMFDVTSGRKILFGVKSDAVPNLVQPIWLVRN